MEKTLPKNASLKRQILYYLYHYQALSTTSMFVLGKNPKHVYRCLKQLEDDKYIKQSQLREAKGRYACSTNYYTLTSKGVQCFRDLITKDTDSNSKDPYLIITDYERPEFRDTAAKAQYISSNGISLIANQLGIVVPQIIPSVKKSDINSLEESNTEDALISSELISYEVYPYTARNSKEKTENKQVYYTPYKAVKETLYSLNDQRQEYKAGRYAGVIESPNKTALIYMGSKLGFRWNSWQIKYEKSACHVFHSHKGHYTNLEAGKINAILFITGPKMFRDIYYDKAGLRSPEVVLGQTFASFVVLPQTYDGIRALENYLISNDSEERAEIISYATASGYSPNTGPDSALFPLINAAGERVYIGTVLDLPTVTRARNRQLLGKFPVEVICTAWQESYYSAIFPNISSFSILND